MLHLVEAPDNSRALTLAAVRGQVRRAPSFTDDDDWLLQAIAAAVGAVEGNTGRQLLTATYELWLDEWPCRGIRPPKAPLQSVEAITYLDLNGAEQTLDEDQYVVLAPAGERAVHGWIEPAYQVVWPLVRCQAGAIKVQFVAGYGDDGDAIPAALTTAMLMLVGHWYQNRETVALGTIGTEVELAYSALVQGNGFQLYPLPETE